MRTIKWTLTDGRAVTYTVELVTEREVNADGDRMTVPCCEIVERCEIPGATIIGDAVPLSTPKVQGGKTLVAVIGGKVGITADIYGQILAARAEAEATPEWQAKLVAERANAAGIAEYEAHRKRMRKVMGY